MEVIGISKVYSTIIAAPSSTKNREHQCDPEAHQVKKATSGTSGIKRMWAEKDSGLVHTLKVTAANVHDVSVASELLTGSVELVYGDSSYLGIEKREDAVVSNKRGRRDQSYPA